MAMIGKIWSTIMKAVEILIVISLCLIGIVLFAQVLARYILNSPMLWPEEATVSLMIWITFLGLSYGVEHRLHVRMNSLVNKLPRKAQQAIAVIMDILMFAAAVYLVPVALDYFQSRVDVISPSLGISYGIVYGCIPVGFILVACSLIHDVVRIIQGDIPQ